MSKFTGALLTFTYNSASHAANFVRSVSISNTGSVVQSTGAADTAETYLGVLEDATVTIELINDSSNAVVLAFYQPLTSSALAVFPNGNTTGKTTITGTMIVTGLDVVTIYNELSLVTVTGQISAGLTFANV